MNEAYAITGFPLRPGLEAIHALRDLGRVPRELEGRQRRTHSLGWMRLEYPELQVTSTGLPLGFTTMARPAASP